MTQVINTKPHASDLIDGVRFTPCEQGMISEEISEEAAARYLTIPGYIRAGGQAAVKAKTEVDFDNLTPEVYAGLRAPQVVEALEAKPERAESIKVLESAREKPRQSVMAAIEAVEAKNQSAPADETGEGSSDAE